MPKELNPEKNKDVIVIARQEDGNWKCWGQKFGKVIEVREISPGSCLERFISHDGK